ncbi:MAG TPA: PVC-type heme-binding CxxCH protein [Pirellulales bacterium]|nr:PVC-type heme-binding CxxCH protein [Pirellulales bacterium]
MVRDPFLAARTSCRFSTLAFLIAMTGGGMSPAFADVADGQKKDHQETFGETNVWSIQIRMAAEEYDAMHPVVAGPGFGAGPPAPPPRNNGRSSEKNLFGTDFPWAEGEFTAAGQTLAKVGIRYAGDITYFVSARGLKRPLKIAFDKSGKQQFRGLSAIQLHAMPLDPSKAREALAYSVFRAAGVPAPRTAFAEVTLTVPGKYDQEYLGLYTVVEDTDGPFVADHFPPGTGLLMRPFRVRGIDFLGEDWQGYQTQYRPQRAPTEDEAKRVIAFARLVNQAGDDEFAKQIDSFLDVDAFLTFMAANALTSNLESFLALGHNYGLYLDAQTGKFHFVPGDLEFSLANFLLMGTAEQLTDLNLMKPYPGENKLPDRLLAVKGMRERYRAIVQKLSATAFASDRLLAQIEAIDKATQAAREREAVAVAARSEPAPGFGGPAPQPPDLRSFVQQRSASIAAQLAGTSQGFAPRPFGPPAGGGGFGPPGRNANTRPIDEQTFRENVQVPPEFEATLFAAPPNVSYPVAISAEPAGAVYVAVDEQGSLGRTPGGGKILRCVDKDDDGKVDSVTLFAKADHPRGLVYRDGAVWVMHPPTLSVFHDDDGDGVSDRQQVLVTGLTTDQITNRGGDHTTNCVRMGIDGWLYIGVGDYGIKRAVGTDGTAITLRGGGVVRVRPDGTELEIYCRGLRNPFDLAIDPYLNIFARDNTNDGAGWDTRVSLLRQTGVYGYTQLYANFTDETMPTLGTFGGGGGTGALFVQEPSWPPQYANSLFTGDWGRSQVYRHELTPHGPTFDLKQEVFLTMPRATGMDIDGSGRLFVASWRGGEAAVFVGPNVGFVARITPKGFDSKADPFPDLKQADLAGLIAVLAAPRSVWRLHTQGEILRRGKDAAASQALERLAGDAAAPLAGRVAALFTLKQLDGRDAHASLLRLAGDPALREFALRALTDRLHELEGVDARPFVAALGDESPRVRGQALVSLGRLNDPSVAASILRLTERPEGSVMPSTRPVQNQPDPDRVVSHLAARALVALRAVDACIEGLDGEHWRGALWVLRSMHDAAAVEKLVKKLAVVRDPELRRGILVALMRLYHREADYQGSWWGIRPDNHGPYYEPVEWEMSERIGAVVTAAVLDADPETVAFLKTQLARHQVALAGLPLATTTATPDRQEPIAVPKADPTNAEQLGNMTFEVARGRVLAAAGDPAKGEQLFKSQSCTACHTTADGQNPKGPHLVDIGKRYKPEELIESIMQPSAKIAQGYESYSFGMVDGLAYTGFVVSESATATRIREANGIERTLSRSEIEERSPQKRSVMPEGLIGNLTAGQAADLLAYLRSLK